MVGWLGGCLVGGVRAERRSGWKIRRVASVRVHSPREKLTASIRRSHPSISVASMDAVWMPLMDSMFRVESG